MLKNEIFKHKRIKYTWIKHTLSALYLCALLSALSASMSHANPLCADLISSSSDSSIRDLLGSPSNTNASIKNTLGSSSQNIFDFYANSKIPKEGTKNFQSYIGELLEEQIIKEPQLTRFIENLEEGELINPISKEEALTSTALLVQRRGIQKYLDQSSLDQKELLDWARATLEKRARVRVSREEVREETRYPAQKLEFHPVKRPVSFEMTDGRNRKFVTLTYPIEVQSTPVTQKQWVEIMGENPSHFAKGEDSVVLNFNGKPIELQPDNPIENVTFWSALEFANRLSEQHGLPPAYDLSGITWESSWTRPEDGTLKPVFEQRHSSKVRIYVKGKSHDPYESDIYYQAGGYRLPTLAEQMYMLRGGEKMKGKSIFKDDSDLAKHAWHWGNSGDRSHPVGLLQPIMIDGKNFYDLYGNVDEWGWDKSTSTSRLEEYREKNPVGLKQKHEDFRRAVGGMGGNVHSFPSALLLPDLQGVVSRFVDPGRVDEALGFRLVRTIGRGDGEQENGE